MPFQPLSQYVARAQKALGQEATDTETPEPVPTGHIESKRQHDIQQLMDRLDRVERSQHANANQHAIDQAGHQFQSESAPSAPDHSRARAEAAAAFHQQQAPPPDHSAGREAVARMLQAQQAPPPDHSSGRDAAARMIQAQRDARNSPGKTPKIGNIARALAANPKPYRY